MTQNKCFQVRVWQELPQEDFMGNIKLSPPYGSFPTDMDRITWWGEFKPFEFWESPDFQAVWINPYGEEIARQNFKGHKCRLAKTTMLAQEQPRGEFQGGMWKVFVTCGDQVIDQQQFAVLSPRGIVKPSDMKPPKKESAMIWVGNALD